MKLLQFSQQMSERTLIPIFVFWAFLTMMTPTLILLSEKSKADLDLNGNTTEAMKVRRMIGYSENHIMRTPTPPARSMVVEEELASAPAPAPAPAPELLPLPTPSLGTSTRANLTESHSHHNHTLSSNRTNDGLTLHVQVKQADSR